MQFKRVSTDQLVTGNIVRVYGMRVQIKEIESREYETGRTVYWSHGTVLNYDEVLNDGFLTAGWFDTPGVWQIQGNELAHWDVEI